LERLIKQLKLDLGETATHKQKAEMINQSLENFIATKNIEQGNRDNYAD
jgi:hypothetical protein